MRKLRALSIALLGKWLWRMRAERQSLWYRVLLYRYGDSDGKLVFGGRKSSSWWTDICSVERVVEGSHNWFSEGIKKKLVMDQILCFGMIFGSRGGF